MITSKPYYQPLFDHMANEHNLTLIESEMGEICRVVAEMERNAPRSFHDYRCDCTECKLGRTVDRLTAEFRQSEARNLAIVARLKAALAAAAKSPTDKEPLKTLRTAVALIIDLEDKARR